MNRKNIFNILYIDISAETLKVTWDDLGLFIPFALHKISNLSSRYTWSDLVCNFSSFKRSDKTYTCVFSDKQLYHCTCMTFCSCNKTNYGCHIQQILTVSHRRISFETLHKATVTVKCVCMCETDLEVSYFLAGLCNSPVCLHSHLIQYLDSRQRMSFCNTRH